MTLQPGSADGNTRRALAQHLRSLEAAGMTDLPKASAKAAARAATIPSSNQAANVSSNPPRGLDAMPFQSALQRRYVPAFSLTYNGDFHFNNVLLIISKLSPPA